jgi:hypothetical protein
MGRSKTELLHKRTRDGKVLPDDALTMSATINNGCCSIMPHGTVIAIVS